MCFVGIESVLSLQNVFFVLIHCTLRLQTNLRWASLLPKTELVCIFFLFAFFFDRHTNLEVANSSGPIATYLRVACLLPKRSLCPAIPFLLPSWFRFERSGFGVGLGLGA